MSRDECGHGLDTGSGGRSITVSRNASLFFSRMHKMMQHEHSLSIRRVSSGRSTTNCCMLFSIVHAPIHDSCGKTSHALTCTWVRIILESSALRSSNRLEPPTVQGTSMRMMDPTRQYYKIKVITVLR